MSTDVIVQDNISLLQKVEIDSQIATAKLYPRNLKTCVEEAIQTATFNDSIARSCIYSLPRDGKNISGPSIRLAEIMVSAWGNIHCSSRLVKNDGKFIAVQAIVIDRQKNNIYEETIERSIMTSAKKGTPRQYSYDMQQTTAAAAASIALRRAVFRLIPKQFIEMVFEQAKKAAVGDISIIRNKAIQQFEKNGIPKEKIFAYYNIKSIEEIDEEILTSIVGIKNAIMEGELIKEQAFDTTYNVDNTTEVETNADVVNAKLLAEEISQS